MPMGWELTDGGTARAPAEVARRPARLSFLRGRSPVTLRTLAVVALASMLALSVYGTTVPASLRCSLPGAVGCAGGFLGPALAAAGTGDQWFDVTMYDWGFWIVDSTSGANETNDWAVFEGWTVHVNATSLPPDTAIGGTAYHGLGVEVNATGQQLLSLAAPVGKWVTATFVAPTTAYYHQHIWCTIQCGPGHGSQQAYVLNIVPGVLYPHATAAANVTSGAAPLSVALSGNGTSGTAPYNYSWSFGDGSPVAYGVTAAHVYTLGGVYYATLTVTDAKGNPGRAVVTITVLSNAPLRANLTANPSSGEAPFATAFSTIAHGGTPPYKYSWSFGDGPNSSGANLTQHVYDSPGVYTAAVTVVDSAGAIVRALALVVVHAPTGTFSLSASAKPANSTVALQTTLTANATGGTSPYSFSWEFGDGTSGTGASVGHLYNQTGSYEATVFAADAAGRTAMTTVHVVATAVNSTGGDGNDSIPIAPIGSSGAAAAFVPSASALVVRIVDSSSSGGAPLALTASASIEGGTGTNEKVSWTFGDGGAANGQVVTHTFSALGSYNVSVTATDSAGNTGSNSTLVRVGALSLAIVANATVGDSPFEVMAGTTITGGTGAFGNVSWSWGDGASSTAYLASHLYGPNASGTVTVRAQVADSAGTVVNATVTLSMRGPPVASLSVVHESTGGIPVAVTFAVSVVGGSGGYATQDLWTFGDYSSTRGPPTENHTYNHTGHFLVTVETNDSSGHLAQAQTWVNISTSLPVLPGGISQPWIFTGVPNPEAAALGLMGIVAATGLAFLFRKRSARRSKAANPARRASPPASPAPPSPNAPTPPTPPG